MSVEKIEKKDEVIFVTKEDHESPSKISLPEPEPSPGLILPNGEINWNCPCLGGMATGPCGLEFREAYSCFHYSTAEQKGSDCFQAFTSMQSCMSEYPALYGSKDNDDLETDDNEQQEHQHKTSSQNELKQQDQINNQHQNDDDEKKTSNDGQQIQPI
ncbi:mitochondrial intermembrane space import and assembly protein 40-B [Aphidius gifuensis]|uniref:mitochondrial intermembrane space import and assembly protein 40-B n=1 Tax=Aphidius gifuensis TaxID=684658 RepID=UPI001CDB8500|nr:mitochondrial intermembrane space import and assembly protein 40-B [Aphidius gifuensis]